MAAPPVAIESTLPQAEDEWSRQSRGFYACPARKQGLEPVHDGLFCCVRAKSRFAPLLCFVFARTSNQRMLSTQVVASGLAERQAQRRTGIVHQVVDEVKTPESERVMYLDTNVLGMLKSWKQQTEFSAAGDWMFASPVHIGRLPYSY